MNEHRLAESISDSAPRDFVQAAERLFATADDFIFGRSAGSKALEEALNAYEAVAHPAPLPERPDDAELIFARAIKVGDVIRNSSRWARVAEVKNTSDIGPTFFLETLDRDRIVGPVEYAADAYMVRRLS